MNQLTFNLTPDLPVEIPFFEEEVIDRTEHCRSFGDELFPTPDSIVDLMLEPYITTEFDRLGGALRDRWERNHLEKYSILDPSAGKGNILDRISERFRTDYDGRYHLCAIEISQDLRHILNDKNHRVLDADFLEFNDPLKFDLIIMNPPFSAGAKHLLHAWNFLDHGGDLVCLLNKETLTNPYTQERKYLLNLIERYGSVAQLDRCFQDSERPTNVEVVMVRLARPKLEAGYNFEGVKFQVDETLDFSDFGQNPLADRNIINTLVKHYEVARNLVIDRYRAQELLNYHLTNVTSEYLDVKDFKLPSELPRQLAHLKTMFWETLFRETKLSDRMNSSFQRNFSSFCSTQSQMSFSVGNIYEVIEQFFLNRDAIMLQGIVEIFDEIVSLSKDNRLGEGWKTNSSYKVNRKIIHPHGITYNPDYGFDASRYHISGQFHQDLDKSVAYLVGQNHYLSISEAIYRHVHTLDRKGQFGNEYAQSFSSSFFEIKIFKKGTVHLKFRNEELWEKFNLTAARGKKWIGQEESSYTKSQGK